MLKAYQLRARSAADGVLWRDAIDLRRFAPIAGFVGPNGGGKSYAMVQTSMPSLDAGRKVLSTVRLLDWRDPRPCDDRSCDCDKDNPNRHRAAHPHYVPWRTWQQLMEAEGCDVLADEITGVASSREYSALPAPVANLLVQLRRRDVCLRWTAPNWRRADVILRECTQMVTVCTGLYPQMNHDEDRMWVEQRLLKFVSYDAALMDDFSAGKTEDLPVWAREFVWRPKNNVSTAYDTYDSVSVIGTVTEGGRCMSCGGTRRAPACSCADYVDGPRRGDAARKRSEDGMPRAAGSVVAISGATARRAIERPLGG